MIFYQILKMSNYPFIVLNNKHSDKVKNNNPNNNNPNNNNPNNNNPNNNNPNNNSKSKYNLKHFINGAISGSFGVLISHPIDTAKTCLQTKQTLPRVPSALYRGILPAISGVGFEKAIVFGTYNNTYTFLQNNNVNTNLLNPISGAMSGLMASFIVTPTERLKILAQSGKNVKLMDIKLTNLYRGITATFTRETPGFAIYFTVYNILKDNYIKKHNELPIYMSFLYGGIAGGSSWFGIYPQDVIKTRMQTQTGNEKMSFMKTVSNIYSDGGIRPFFKGFHFALMRAIPLHAGTFMMMEIMQKYN